MYFAPLYLYALASGIAVKRIMEPTPEFGWTMVCNAAHLTPELIRHFKNNSCPVVAFSCNDSAYLTQELHVPELELINLVFTISGVQTSNWSTKSVMNEDMTVSTERVPFLDIPQWIAYDQMRKEKRLLPLPYVPWDRLEEVPIPAVKTPKILFRGGNHFWRFVVYLYALKAGLAHPASGFLTEDYFRYDMVPQFQYCARCRAERNLHGHLPATSARFNCECPELSLSEPLVWNNRTPRRFFKLAEQFGVEDMKSVESALNFKRQSAREHLAAIADAAFFCDMKWEFSIHTAQRFWEAASVGTVNLMPRRVNDQEHFPVVNDCEHYLTFANDFSDIGTSGFWSAEVGARVKSLYEHWIKPSDYVTNTNLLRHILQQIERCCP